MTAFPAKPFPGPSRADLFATTRWSVIRAAAGLEGPRSSRALQELCEIYWYPLYAYVRRRGFSKQDAEDLTQEFFARFLIREDFRGKYPQAGKFRAFLLASMKHFLANARDKQAAKKRGGGAFHHSLDWEQADSRFQLADPGAVSPETAFDREWALALLETAVARLRNEWIDCGRGNQFDVLKIFLTQPKGTRPTAETAAALGMQPSATRVAIHRLRKRCRQILREEIAETITAPTPVDDEMRALFAAFQ